MHSTEPTATVEQLRKRFETVDREWRDAGRLLEDLGKQIATLTAEYAVGDRVEIIDRFPPHQSVGTFEICELHHVGMSMRMQYKGRRVSKPESGVSKNDLANTIYSLWHMHCPNEFEIRKVAR